MADGLTVRADALHVARQHATLREQRERSVGKALTQLGVETKQVELREAIRQLDTMSVPVRFGDDLTVEVKVWIVRESTSDVIEEEKKPERQREQRPRREGGGYGDGSEIDALETDL